MIISIRRTIVAHCCRRQSTAIKNNIQSIRCDSTTNNDDKNNKNDLIKNKPKFARFKLDKSKVPLLNEKDLEEHFVSGSGPGGQSVNKAVNCCQIKHIPTGFAVKVHHTRSLESNRKIARELLVEKLDNLYNGENSVANQKKRIAQYKLSIKEAQQERLRSLKMKFNKMRVDE